MRVFVLLVCYASSSVGVATIEVDPAHDMSVVLLFEASVVSTLYDIFDAEPEGRYEVITSSCIMVIEVKDQVVICCRKLKWNQDFLVPDNKVVLHGDCLCTNL